MNTIILNNSVANMNKRLNGRKRACARVGRALLLFVGTSAAWAVPTPMDLELKDDSTTLIECDVSDAKETMVAFARVNGDRENPGTSSKTQGYHYSLYIPKGYSANKDYKYPCLFISSPGGNAKMGIMTERLKRDEWVVVNGKLEQNKKIATEAQAWKTELAKIKQSKEVVEFTKTARKAFIDAQAAEAVYLNLMKHGSWEYGKMKMTPSEKQAIKKAIAAYRAVAETYPDTSFAPFSKVAAESLDIALSKAG